MRSQVAYAGKSPGRGTHRLDGRAATILVAVIAGIYLGASTSAEIDPFYRNAQARSGNGSYTIDGWRGADAARPPVSVSPQPPAGNFGSGPPILRHRYSDYPGPVTYVGDLPAADRDFDRVNADDGAWADGDCPDCSPDAPIAAEPEPEAMRVPAGCADGDPACPSEEQGSAPPADF